MARDVYFIACRRRPIPRAGMLTRAIESPACCASHPAPQESRSMESASVLPVLYFPLSGEIGDVNFFPHWRGCNPVARPGAYFPRKCRHGKRCRCRSTRRSGVGRRQRQTQAPLRHRGNRHRHRPGFRPSTLSRRRSLTPGDWPSSSRSLRSAMHLRFSRMLGIAGRRSGDGCLAGGECPRGLPASGRDKR